MWGDRVWLGQWPYYALRRLLQQVYTLLAPALISQPQVAAYQYPYGDHPFWPSQTETTSNGFLDPQQIVGSDACGDCHAEIQQQWRAHAWVMPCCVRRVMPNLWTKT